MAQFPGLTLWTDAWIADTKHLTRGERGTYLDLLVLMWRTPSCKVPNDNLWLAKHLAMTVVEVAAELRPLINEFCQTDGNWLYQKRLQHEFVRRFETHRAQSGRAKHKRNKKKSISPELAENHDPAKPPTLPLPHIETSFFPTAATPVDNPESAAPKQLNDDPARSFATASNGDALAREPDSEPAERKRSADKNPVEMTLAEINAAWRGNGRHP